MKNEKLLLMIDIQNDYFPGGNLELDSPEKAAKNANRLLEFFRTNNLPVIHIKNEAVHTGATFLLPGTSGCDFHPLVKPRNREDVIIKHYPNSFRETELQNHLLQYDPAELIVCGMMTHMCVSSTIRAGWDLGWKMTLVYDACATRAFSLGEEFVDARSVHLSHIAALERFADIVSTDNSIKKLMQTTQ